ncbi:MAG TPA: VTT domain-containing protein [Terriglobales bacterium]
MNNLLHAVSQHGYVLIFVIVLAEAVGFPVPAALALVAAGAAAAAHILNPSAVFLVSLVAMLIGDTLLFFIGRYTGWGLLGFLCGLSLNPETCILRSAESFYKRGRITLLFAKFIPGVNTIAPPLAGSMKMPTMQFIQLDAAGGALYILAYGVLGYAFRDFVVQLTHGLQTASHAVAEVILIGVLVYAAYRIVQYRRYKLSGVVPRIAAVELAKRVASGAGGDFIVADVRSHGYYDSGAARIAGSIRIEPNKLAQEIETLPRDKDIYLYCT